MSEPIMVDDEGEREAEELAKSRKEKRKELKKKKRREKRREVAAKEREDEEARLNDPEELKRLLLMEEEERERLERERLEFEERERIWREERKKEDVEEEERLRMMMINVPEVSDSDKVDENCEGIDWEYEDGPAEIIWQGNEIIVKKKRIRVQKKNVDHHTQDEDADRPTSNPLPPQSEAVDDYCNASNNVYDNIAHQVSNFGTEKDKSHCPFHIKTGACRFEPCRRVHLYPDKACTILIKNMFNGPGLASAWERDEGLEYTDEEAERCYEEFYEDVHTEFLKFGEIVNFKVCRNGSFHLRGNVYVHYKSLDSAMLAYQSINGRYFAKKQVTCEYVGVTKWKIAICGEYMKSRLKTCSRGTECNFIHCFRNPGGDYEWADWDKPPPRYWVEKMSALFGSSDESLSSCSHMRTADADRHLSRRSRSRDTDRWSSGSGRSNDGRSDPQKRNDDRKRIRVPDGKKYEERTNFIEYHHPHSERETHDTDSDRYLSDRDREVEQERDRYHGHAKKSSRRSKKISEISDDYRDDSNMTCEVDSDKDKERGKHRSRTRKSSKHRNKASRSPENHDHRRKWTDDNESGRNMSDRNRESHKSHRHQKICKFSDEDNNNIISEDGMPTKYSTSRERRESQVNEKKNHDDYTNSGEHRSDRESDSKKHGTRKKLKSSHKEAGEEAG